MFALSHDMWEEWEPPEDHRPYQKYRDRVHSRLWVLARMAITSQRAKKDDTDLKQEVSVLKCAHEILRQLSKHK